MNKIFKIIIPLIIISFLFFLVLTRIYECPVKLIFGLSCPGCGMTRAALSLLRFDFKSAFYYHALWPLVPFTFALILLNKLKKLSLKHLNMILVIIGVIGLLYYLYRLFSGSDIVYFDFSESLLYKIFNK